MSGSAGFPQDGARPFTTASGLRRGYEKAAVDSFLAHAREAFETDAVGLLTAAEIRRTAFPVVKGGYRIAQVDAALGRIEDAFAHRERERALAAEGAAAWVEDTRALAQEVLDRLSRPPGHRFRRAGRLHYGYRVDEVDLVADKLARYLETGESLTVEQVRTVAFRLQRGGYREDQVDAVLDAMVEVLLAVG
ncbi:DivIVA domain-containing protein [Microbacterium sp.]|uniref:DivIVA domain-containing protein n=1 Tax=Microbacterium sp. TaxID=51671 RepID=UPI0039E45EB2